MLNEPVSVSIASAAPRIDACELCTTGGEALRATVTIRHVHGGAMSLAACDRCAAAVRRIIAAAGGASINGPAMLSRGSINVADLDQVVLRDAPPDVVGSPVLAHEYSETFQATEGVSYVVRVWAQGRTDGTWIGWITFIAPETRAVRRTPRETSQSSFDHVQYWATGLQTSYIQGAFQRSS